MKKNLFSSLLIGASVSAVAFYFAIRHVPFLELLQYLKTINYLWLFPAVLTVLLTLIVRAQRWQIILATTHKINFWQSFHPMMIGFMLNLMFPGRVGEIARPTILSRKEKVPFTTAFATIAAERLFDIILLLVWFFILISIVNIDPKLDIPFGAYHLNKTTLENISFGMAKLCAVLIVGIILISLKRSRQLIIAVVDKVPSFFFMLSLSVQDKIKTLFCQPLIKIIDNLAATFSLIKSPSRLCLCLGLSLILGLLYSLSYFVLALGFPDLQLSFLELSAVSVIVCFFIALPSVPGFWGLWEAGGVFAMALFGVAQKDAFGYTLINHVVQILPVMLIGFVSTLLLGINIWKFRNEKQLS